MRHGLHKCRRCGQPVAKERIYDPPPFRDVCRGCQGDRNQIWPTR